MQLMAPGSGIRRLSSGIRVRGYMQEAVVMQRTMHEEAIAVEHGNVLYTTARMCIVAIITAVVVVQLQASTAVLAESIPAHP